MRRLGTLIVDDVRARACFTARLLAHRDVKRMVDALQRAVPIPQLEIMVHRAFRRQILGQRLPLAAGPQDVENPVQDLAHIHRAFAAAMPGGRDHGLHDRPFGIGQIAWITKATAVRGYAVFGLPHRALPQRESSAHE